MKRSFILFILIALSYTMKAQELAPYVDIQKYQGPWYVIAYKPTFLDGNWINTIESYTWCEEKGVYDVLTTYNTKPGGKRKSLKQELIPVKGSQGASWVAKIWWFIRADYSIHKVADDYSWVVMGHPKRKYMYIMARTPKMDENLYQELYKYALSLGYKAEDIKRQPQQE